MSMYKEIEKKIAGLQHQLREYRLVSLRKQLALIVDKDRRVIELENRLSFETSRVLQCQFVIDEILDELESIV